MKSLILLFLTSYVFGHEYMISDKPMKFIYVKSKLVSENCHKTCTALSKKVSKLDSASFDKEGGKNPATQACKLTGGEIVEAKSNLGHKTFFCKFEDNSYIHSGHLL